MSCQDLIPAENFDPVTIYSGDALDKLLAKIAEHAESFEVNLETDAGRKKVASNAYAVSQAKVKIDDAGKTITAGWKAKCAEVDKARKKAREYLDELRDSVRKPLTDWEDERERIAEAAETERKAEEERIAKAEREEAERQERERIAQLEQRETDLKQREEKLAKAEAEAAEREKERQEAEDDAAAEALVDDAITIETAEAAAQRQYDATDLAALRTEQQKWDDLLSEERKAVEPVPAAGHAKPISTKDRKRLDSMERRRNVNACAVSVLVANGVSEATAKRVIVLIVSGAIPGVTVEY